GTARVVAASQAVPAVTPYQTQKAGIAMPGAAAAGSTLAPTPAPPTSVPVAAATQDAAATPVSQPAVPVQPSTELSNPTDQTGLFLGVGGMVAIVIAMAAVVTISKRQP
ncbi:MAG TPA: hypothetical protein VGK81_09205, partial [Anaerolineae bacterium]